MSNAAPSSDHAKERKRLYALLHIGKEKLGWDEDFYRGMLAQHGARLDDAGRYSAKTMALPQLEAVLQHQKRCGFRPTRSQAKVKRLSDWREPLIGKITKLWFLLADAGVVRNPSKAAMAKWCAQHTGVAKLEWAEKKGLIDSVEGLKSWCKREGVRIE